MPEHCPQCESKHIRQYGLGSEKVEADLQELFPKAQILRWDWETTRQKNAHEVILGHFVSGRADVLVGTQMLAKGLDIPKVTLVGIVSADTILHLPDFRACERTFQLLCQVAGRAGRGPNPGRVVIQTYTPAHYAVKTAARHDYQAFYEQEIENRRQYANPPFSNIINLICTHTNDSLCQQEAVRLQKVLINERDSKGVPNIDVIGPFPAFFHRLRGKYRWQIILKGDDPSGFLRELPLPKGWIVDIDPMSLL
jgi:primosomal protein N' (replication factor Y)